MATLLLTPIIFSALNAATVPFAPLISPVIGGALGGVVDTQFLFPAVFGKGNAGQSGPRINDLQISSASEGSPIGWCTGGKNRVAGQIIWMGEVQTVTKKVTAGGKGFGSSSASQEQVSYFVDFAVAFVEGPINAYRRIWADSKLIYDNVTSEKADPSAYDSLVGYTGAADQDVDPTMEAALGSGNVPAYRGTSYVVFKSFNITGGMPQTFSAYVEQEDNQSLSTAIARIMNRAERVQDVDYDVNSLPGRIEGVFTADIQPTAQTLESMILTYNLGVQEVEGKLVFFPYSESSPIEIDNRDLAAHEAGEEAPDQISVTDNASINLPSEVVVTYFDVDNYFQQGAQRSKQLNRAAINVDNISVPVTLSATQAKTLAYQSLWSAWSQRQTVTFSLPPSYLGVFAESDIVKVNFQGSDFLIKLNTVDRGNNYLINCTGTFYDPDVLDQNVTADDLGIDAGAPVTSVYLPPQMLLVVADVAPLIDDHVDHHGLYWAGAALDPTKEFRGAELFSTEGSGSPNDVEGMSVEATVGKTTDALPSVEFWECWDRFATVTVQLSQGTLVSVTADEVLSGTNWALVGKEIIGFVNATLTGPNTYKLDTLIRGRRNTQTHTTDHAIGDKFLLLDQSVVHTVNHLNNGDIGQDFDFQLPSSGMELSDVGADGTVDLTYTAQMRTPFSAARVWGVRDASGNLTINWIRRTRALTSFLSGSAPLAEDSEKYEIDIFNGSTLLRTVKISWDEDTMGDVPNYLYTAALQTTDGFTPSVDPVTIHLYQMSAVVGRGTVNESIL